MWNSSSLTFDGWVSSTSCGIGHSCTFCWWISLMWNCLKHQHQHHPACFFFFFSMEEFQVLWMPSPPLFRHVDQMDLVDSLIPSPSFGGSDGCGWIVSSSGIQWVNDWSCRIFIPLLLFGGWVWCKIAPPSILVDGSVELKGEIVRPCAFSGWRSRVLPKRPSFQC